MSLVLAEIEASLAVLATGFAVFAGDWAPASISLHGGAALIDRAWHSSVPAPSIQEQVGGWSEEPWSEVLVNSITRRRRYYRSVGIGETDPEDHNNPHKDELHLH